MVVRPQCVVEGFQHGLELAVEDPVEAVEATAFAFEDEIGIVERGAVVGAQTVHPDGRVRATFEIVWLSGWAPHESQQKPLKPGSASWPMFGVQPMLLDADGKVLASADGIFSILQPDKMAALKAG